MLNASPRKRANTAELCKCVAKGAQSNGADVEYIDLYSYDFKGCMSCFACHLKKNKNNPLCYWRDDLKEILKKCLESDAIVIGTPIYYGSITSYAQAFLESCDCSFITHHTVFASLSGPHFLERKSQIIDVLSNEIEW